MPRAEVTRDQRSLLCKRSQAAVVCTPGSPGPSHKLSLLDVVLAPSSVSRAQSLRSQLSGVPPSSPSIQGWAAIWSREGRSEGRRDRHHSMSCWHSAGKGEGQGGAWLPGAVPAPGSLGDPHEGTGGGPCQHLGRLSFGRTGGPVGSPHPARRGCRHTPCHRGALPGTTRWPNVRGSGGNESTRGGCTPECLKEHAVIRLCTPDH